MVYGTVACLGDSLTYGARAQVGYPELLPDLMRNEGSATEWAIRNFGVSKETTRQVLDRTPAAVGWLAGQPGAKQLVLLAGTNDSKGAGQGMSLDQWESLYRQIVHWPRRYGIPLVLCTFPPLEPDTREMPYFTDRSREWLLEANGRIRTMQGELHCAPAPVVLCDLADMPIGYLCDGVHLKPSGYAWLARRIATALGYPQEEKASPRQTRRPQRRVVRPEVPKLKAVTEF